MKIGIWNINLGLHNDQKVGHDQRLKNIGDKILAKQKEGFSLDLLAINEAKAHRIKSLIGRQVEYKEDKHLCLINNKNRLSTDCLKSMANTTNSKFSAYQVGEIGVIYNKDKFKREGKLLVKKLGVNWWKTVKRRVVGVRLRIRETNQILPFYSTHISATKSSNVIKKQLNELRGAIKDWQKKGDLPPIVVGDFNDHKWKKKHWKIMEEAFDRVELPQVKDKIEHCWIGKKSYFKHTYGSISATKALFFRDFIHDSLTDHGVPLIEIKVLPQFVTATSH